MRLTIDTTIKEVVILENVDFIQLHKTLLKLIGKRDLVNWKVVTTETIVQQWYPYYGGLIHYNPIYPATNDFFSISGTYHLTDDNKITSTNSNTTNSIIYSNGEVPMICTYNDDGSMNVQDNSIGLVVNSN